MKKISIVLVLLFTLAFSTRAIANLTLGTTSVSSNGPLTLSTSSSTLVLPTTNGTNGQVLTTNGSGVTSWTTVSGGGGGITNSAGAGVIPVSDGTNLVASRITDNGPDVIVTSNSFTVATDNPAHISFTTPNLNYASSNLEIKAAAGVIGDFEGDANNTYFSFSNSSQTIKAQTTGTFCAGDCDATSNGTKITVSDGPGTVSIQGALITGNIFANQADGSDQIGAVDAPFGSLYLGNADTNNIQLTGTATVPRTITLPDASGTVKLGINYKVYTALLTQSGTSAPVATVLENTLGGAVVWTRAGAGGYLGTLNGQFSGSVAVFISGRVAGGSFFAARKDSDDAILVRTATSNGAITGNVDDGFEFDPPPGDNILLDTPIEIRVYP